MQILLFANSTRPDAVDFAGEIRRKIISSGNQCIGESEADSSLQPQCCVVVGGDGTVLRAVRWLVGIGMGSTPIWAVNCGHMGYLTDCEKDAAMEKLPTILKGKYSMEKRIMLSGSIGSGRSATSFFALNEVVIHRSGFARSLDISLTVDGKGILEFFGDGLLISTPTGSTAYNLSAGGPLLLPTSNLMVITPVCPHSPLCAPLVVPGSSTISLKIAVQTEECDIDRPQAVIDGCLHMPFVDGDSLTCTVADSTANFIRTDDAGFYSRLASKFLKNS